MKMQIEIVYRFQVQANIRDVKMNRSDYASYIEKGFGCQLLFSCRLHKNLSRKKRMSVTFFHLEKEKRSKRE